MSTRGRFAHRLLDWRLKFLTSPFGMIGFAMFALTAIGCTSFQQRTLTDHMASDRYFHDASELKKLGRVSSAERLLRESLAYEPQNAEAHQRLAELYAERGALDEAIRQLQTALDSGCKSAAVHAQLGKYYLAAGKFQPARHHSQLAIDMSQHSSIAWELAGDVASAEGEWAQALSAYHRAASCESADPQIRLKICHLYLDTNRPIRALATIEDLVTKYPSQDVPESVLVMHGMILTEMKNYQLAIEQLKTAVGRPDPSPEAYLRLSNAQLLAGYQRQAEQTLVAGHEAFPDVPMFGELLARAENSNDGRVTALR